MAKQQCSHCGQMSRYEIEPACRACRYPVTLLAPNVQLARSQRDALASRFASAHDVAHGAGRLAAFERLCEIAGDSHVVVGLPVRKALDFVTEEHLLYAPYQRLVGAGARAPAPLEHDRRRRRVDADLYGGYGEDIVYGALSTDGSGLTSYGDVHFELLDVTVAHRATVLERNSFVMASRFGEEMPAGYLSTWDERGKLAATKLVAELPATRPDAPETPDDHALGALLLRSDGDRATDEFLEVHVYEGFNRDALRRVTLPERFPNEVDDVMGRAIRETVAPEKLRVTRAP